MAHQIKVDTLALGPASIELMPVKEWRDLAKKGRVSMRYKLFAGGVRLPNGETIAVEFTVPAPLNDEGDIPGLGKAGGPEVVKTLQAKTEDKIDSAKLRYGADGAPLEDASGGPVYAEAVVTDDGKPFDLFFGTYWFVHQNPGIRIELAGGVTLTPSGRQTTVKDGGGNERKVDVFHADAADYNVTRVAVASGTGLRKSKVGIGTTAGGDAKQAARAAALASEQAPLAM